MNGGATKPIAVLVAALLVVSVLSACGSGGDSTASSSSTQTVASSTSRGVETGPLTVVGGGSASYRTPGHYANVPGFGEEASKADLEQAATSAHEYLVARVEKDWPKACSYVSDGLLQRLASHANLAGQDCAAVLAKVKKPGTGGSAYESSEVEAESLRASGVWAFLLYRAATAPFFMPMVKGNDGWKVNLLVPIAFYG